MAKIYAKELTPFFKRSQFSFPVTSTKSESDTLNFVP